MGPAVAASNPPLDCCLAFFRTVNVVTALSAGLCLVAFGMAIATGPPFTDRTMLYVQLLRVYGMALACCLALVETEVEWLIAFVRLMDVWTVRGACQAFLAIMTLELVHSNGNSDFDKSVRLYRNVSGMCMLGCSGFYFLGGILCLGALRNARYRRFQERARVERDLESLEKQREELRLRLGICGKD